MTLEALRRPISTANDTLPPAGRLPLSGSNDVSPRGKGEHLISPKEYFPTLFSDEQLDTYNNLPLGQQLTAQAIILREIFKESLADTVGMDRAERKAVVVNQMHELIAQPTDVTIIEGEDTKINSAATEVFAPTLDVDDLLDRVSTFTLPDQKREIKATRKLINNALGRKQSALLDHYLGLSRDQVTDATSNLGLHREHATAEIIAEKRLLGKAKDLSRAMLPVLVHEESQRVRREGGHPFSERELVVQHVGGIREAYSLLEARRTKAPDLKIREKAFDTNWGEKTFTLLHQAEQIFEEAQGEKDHLLNQSKGWGRKGRRLREEATLRWGIKQGLGNEYLDFLPDNENTTLTGNDIEKIQEGLPRALAAGVGSEVAGQVLPLGVGIAAHKLGVLNGIDNLVAAIGLGTLTGVSYFKVLDYVFDKTAKENRNLLEEKETSMALPSTMAYKGAKYVTDNKEVQVAAGDLVYKGYYGGVEAAYLAYLVEAMSQAPTLAGKILAGVAVLGPANIASIWKLRGQLRFSEYWREGGSFVEAVKDVGKLSFNDSYTVKLGRWVKGTIQERREARRVRDTFLEESSQGKNLATNAVEQVSALPPQADVFDPKAAEQRATNESSAATA